MSDRKLAKAVQSLLKEVRKLHRRISKAFVTWLLRAAFIVNRRSRASVAGFILPTTVLLILVVTLTAGALIFRAYNYNTIVIGESQQRVIYNAATPAIDRARAKLESLFNPDRDTRYPGGVPAENYLAGMLRNDGSYGVATLGTPALPDPYTLPDETRINLDGQKKPDEGSDLDNAWAFRTDTDGDGKQDATVVYSILLQTPPDTDTAIPGSGLVSTSDLEKANNLYVRTAPLSNRQRGNCSVGLGGGVASAAQGWFQDLSTSSTLRKNFQVDAVVIPDNASSRNNFVTLEMQQDRQLDRGNKWGAWFRNDLEIFPGADFNFNGAMHTEGSLIIKPNQGGTFTSYLVSAQNSCLMAVASNSEVTVTKIDDTNKDKKPVFYGGALSGAVWDNNYGGSSVFHVYNGTNNPPDIANLDTGSQSANGTGQPSEVALDPITLLTRGLSFARGANPPTTINSNANNVDTAWKGLPKDGNPRISTNYETQPYVDDLYRADDRWGPKPRYNDKIVLNGATQQPGTLITAANAGTNFNALVSSSSGSSNVANVGLDGYWERRAFNEGLRLIVGQRLELGNAFGWTQPAPLSPPAPLPAANIPNADPLYPAQPRTSPAGTGGLPVATSEPTISHEKQQRRTLRDNLAAVQGTAVYHNSNPSGGADFPVACLASTVHPGTVLSLQQSVTFKNLPFNPAQPQVLTNFLVGQGTNGWEFYPPASVTTPAGSTTAATADTFETAIAPTQPLGKALRNLAYFAGDPKGAFPPAPDATGFVHPYPNLAMWGNFSELRRTLSRLDGIGTPVTSYKNLSLADKTNLHTAACTLGMLAYNIDTFAKYDYQSTANQGNTATPSLIMLGDKIIQLIDGRQDNGEVKDPRTGDYFTFTGTNAPGTAYAGSAPTAYAALPPEAFLTALQTEPLTKLNLGATTAIDQPQRDTLVTIGRIVLGKQQTQRDRIYGFRDAVFPPLNTPLLPSPYGSPLPAGLTAASRDNNGKYNNSATAPDALKDSKLDCDPATFALLDTPDGANANRRAALALAFCESKPSFPALFYLFPRVAHDHDGDPASKMDPGLPPTIPSVTNEQPGAITPPPPTTNPEPYITDSYIKGTNAGLSYQVVDTPPPTSPADGLPNIALQPRKSDFSDWLLPHLATPRNVADANVSPNRIVAPDNTIHAVGFLDRAIFDGRQMMTTRVMDIDLGMLRSLPLSTTNKPWLPVSGIVYAFREDAVREDAIARPPSNTPTSGSVVQTNATNPANPTDPALTTTQEGIQISTKQVDYIPDPDRRPHGFRLRNGAQLKRNDAPFKIPIVDNIRGLSFFSDNPVYIQGSFNLHQDGTDDTVGARLEEFTRPLPDDRLYTVDEFYGRTDREPNFAKLTVDRWRPTEVLADAVSILSEDFCDGSIEDTFATNVDASVYHETKTRGLWGPGCTANTSFRNQNLPTPTGNFANPVTIWARENSSETPSNPPPPIVSSTSSVKIDRNGNPLVKETRLSTTGSFDPNVPNTIPYTGADATYQAFATDKTRQWMTAKPATVNTIMVSGIVASRTNQSYGGLHNFPRFLENWGGKSLRFNGSFLQLNFSNYATAPLDQEAWEPGGAPTPAENLKYYQPPTRLWGYDPALQLAPAGPAASRFVSSSRDRSEYYSEIAANDPYVNGLCTAFNRERQAGRIAAPANVNCP